MSLALKSNVSAMAGGRKTFLSASGGTLPYSFAIVPGGAGGSLTAVSGNPEAIQYTAPNPAPADPAASKVTIRVTDDDANTADVVILVTDPLGLFCDIIQKELGLSDGRVYLWDQKIFQPTDSGLYIAVSVISAKPFANSLVPVSGSGLDAVQSLNMLALIGIDVISRSTEALRRKEEVLMALASSYSQSQQEANSFNIGLLPFGGQFVNLSNVDGAAIPYRFNISVNMQYFSTKIKAIPYFDTFEDPAIATEP